ncbi:Arachidonate 12-lipoxygenase, epidermal-type [Sciurus carolinensis]|uniref:Arachidonate 12-lipoxygenase, epidermal-type n=1 Tax=Sciurus carolinensis TaxID=30640 RepID=A0AA41ME08_SCICA|nr:Arachidonate 12-lipoxygenase, epidermal-type [Sciurus carolinensis]
MGKYMIRVAARESLLAGSTNLVQLWLVGEHGEADLGKLLRLLPGRKTDLEIDVPLHLGRLLLVKLRKHKDLLNFDWFCKWITVQGPGTQGRSVSDEPQNLFKEYQEQELEDRRKVLSTGSGGHMDILQRATACLTYCSFCPPHDLAYHGLLGVKSSLYGQDALRLWEIISRFPLSLDTQAQFCQIVYMCIFTCTGQHASAHLGQVVMGQHREKYFSGPGPQAVLKQFLEELADMDRDIKVQHAGLDLPYEYLQPSMVENSVTI